MAPEKFPDYPLQSGELYRPISVKIYEKDAMEVLRSNPITLSPPLFIITICTFVRMYIPTYICIPTLAVG